MYFLPSAPNSQRPIIRYLMLLGLLPCLLLTPPELMAQNRAMAQELLFGSDAVIDITLTTDFKKLHRERKNEKYQPAEFRFRFPDGREIQEKLEVKARGILRMTMCPNPPLFINFRKARDTVLKQAGALKLVVGCDRGQYPEQLILKEYLAYRMYNLLTQKSIRPRLLRIHYTGSEEGFKPFDQYAFLLEDIDEVARRNDCRHITDKVRMERINRENLTLFSLFQFMIGNTDFTVLLNKNTRLLLDKKDSTGTPFVVPYDFDYSGLVNARYAIPHPDFQHRITTVTDRMYMGQPRNKQELQPVIQLFLDKRVELESLIRNQQELWPLYLKEMIHFLEGFFDLINDPKKVEELFVHPEPIN